MRWHLEPFLRPAEESWAVRIQVFDEDFEDHEERTPDPPVLSYFHGPKRLTRAVSPVDLVGFAVQDVHAAVPEKVRDFLMLHAGAVARDGAAVVMPAPPDVGKSSLVTALLLREEGFGYLSDEVGAVDPITTQLWPFQKHISLDRDAVARLPGLEERLADDRPLTGELRQRFVRPADVGSEVARPAPLHWVVFPTPHRGGPPSLRPLGRAETVSRLASLSFNLYRYQERGVVLLSRVAEEVESFELNGGSPSERAALLSERLVR